MNRRMSLLLLTVLVSSCAPTKPGIKVIQFTPEPLIEGSEVMLVELRHMPGVSWYTLSTGADVPDTRVELIRELASQFDGREAEIAELLLALSVTKDDMERRYFVCPRTDPLGLYIGFDDSGTHLRFKVEYRGKDWLFVKSFKVSADEYRWQSPAYAFQRRVAGGVEEWIDVPATPNEIELVRTLAQAQKALVRFQGSQGNADAELPPLHKANIVRILRLYELMTRKPSVTSASTDWVHDVAIVRAIKGSDDFERHKDAFVTASKRLTEEGRCSLAALEYNGGWVRSQSHGGGKVYFTYCVAQNATARDRIYLNVNTGELFK